MIGKFLFVRTGNLDTLWTHLGLLGVRLFAGCTMAFAHGVNKIPPTEMFISYVDRIGLPSAFLFAWLAGLSEFVGGILVALGLLSRPASMMLMITMFVAAFWGPCQ